MTEADEKKLREMAEQHAVLGTYHPDVSSLATAFLGIARAGYELGLEAGLNKAADYVVVGVGGFDMTFLEVADGIRALASPPDSQHKTDYATKESGRR